MKVLGLLLSWLAVSQANVVDTSCISQDLLKSPPQDEVRAIINKGQRDFSVNLIKNMFHQTNSTGGTNIFVSPSGIYQTLMLAYFGADGVTEKELSKVMGLEGQVTKDEAKKSHMYEKAFQAVREKNPNLGYKLIHSNKFFFDRSLPVSSCMQLVLQNELGVVDFATNPEKARVEINKWVEERTLKKIQNFLPPGSVDGSTQVSLTNAAYFKGQWASQFKPKDTKRDNFYVNRNTIKVTKFMKQKGQFNYYTSEELRSHVLQLPYVGEDISMLIILPPFEDDSLAKTVALMTPEKIQGVVAEIKSGFFKIEDLNVEIPKFNIDQSMDLASTLSVLGVPSLFDASKVNLTNFFDGESDVHVSLQSARHKSFIEVNEEGSEAAAATALFGFRSARPLFYKDFIANHPFMFLIYDEKTDIILFFGVMQDPSPKP